MAEQQAGSVTVTISITATESPNYLRLASEALLPAASRFGRSLPVHLLPVRQPKPGETPRGVPT